MNRFRGTQILLHGSENLQMLAAAFAMQENLADNGSAGGVSVDRVKAGFYSCGMFCPCNAGGVCCCTCSPPCG
jgi:hypothetical protein